jgi:hypothetical protein
MDLAVSCIQDAVRSLLDEARQAKELAVAKRGTPEQDFEVGMSRGLAEALQTLANRLHASGLDSQLNGSWDDLCAFLDAETY